VAGKPTGASAAREGKLGVAKIVVVGGRRANRKQMRAVVWMAGTGDVLHGHLFIRLGLYTLVCTWTHGHMGCSRMSSGQWAWLLSMRYSQIAR
jgi:hypothetical protein